MHRSSWKALHESLACRVNTLEAHRTFNNERQCCPDLEPFEHPIALVDFLTDRSGDLDQKDRIYAALVELAKSECQMGLPMALLWLGLWPGLEAIYRRNLRHYRHDPDELVSEIWERFVIAVERAELNRIRRVAATLIRNTERALTYTRRDSSEHLNDQADPITKASQSSSDLGLPPGLTPEQEVDCLRVLITEVVGKDAELVIGVAIYKENQRELCERLGLSHESTRKRYQRAIERLRNFLQEK